MINASDAYRAAIVGDTRRILLKAVVDIIDPDIVYRDAESSSMSPYSKPEQLHDKDMGDLARYETLELNRWLLNGSFRSLPDNPQDTTGQMAYMSDVVCGADGTFSPAVWMEQPFSGVSILQACSVYFPNAAEDGFPVNFTIDVMQGGTSYFSRTFTGNTETQIDLDGFTVNNPDAIRVTVTKWSLPYRRFRTVEILPGIYEVWDGGDIASFKLKHQGDVSCLTLPYGTCQIKMDNVSRRFEPRNKSGLFQSIEERQGIDVSMACRLPDGTDEYKRLGIFYQFSGGWKTGDNGMAMQWDLIDIVGLLSGREFIPPSALPTTLGGWAAELVAQLGVNFETRYTVADGFSDVEVSVRDAADVVGMKCGDLLRYVCMATGTWPRADAETGYLAIEPLWDNGAKITLDNLVNYPGIKANDDIAALIFTLNDGNGTQYIVSGNSTASNETKSIQNPFIKTPMAALVAARLILSAFGGNRLEIIGRGDPSSEIGDVDTVWLNESTATTARRIQQDLSLEDGVLKNCSSVLLQADGSFEFEGRAVISESGVWTAPAGVTQLRVILVGKGGNGTDGTDGSWTEAGVDGTDGLGGKVWASTIQINPQQTFEVSIGDNTAFGQYSSANGQIFQYGYTDIASGDSFGRTGVSSPIAGTGDGGAGGVGGVQGSRHDETIRDTDDEGNVTETTITVIDNYPGTGTQGVDGVTGCVVVYWDIPEESA